MVSNCSPWPNGPALPIVEQGAAGLGAETKPRGQELHANRDTFAWSAAGEAGTDADLRSRSSTEALADDGIIGRPCRGSVTIMRVPSPGLLSTATVPP